MFKLRQKETFTYPVAVESVGDGGVKRKDSFNAEFKRLSTTEVGAWVSRIGEAQGTSAEEAMDAAKTLAREVVVGWSDVREETGGEIEFTLANLNQMLEIHPLPLSIAFAWLEAVNGGAKRKN